MRIVNLGERLKWKINKDDIKNASSDDLILMKIPGGVILLKIQDMINRYERGEGNNGKASIDWIENGKHQSYDGDTKIPDWMDSKNYVKQAVLRESLFHSKSNETKIYNMGSDFREGDILTHSKFGKGIVLMRSDNKVMVLFHDGTSKELAINTK